MILNFRKKLLVNSLLLCSLLFIMTGCGDDGQTKVDPAKPQDETALIASDYSDKENWLMLPQENQHDVDVIYFYPTAYTPQSESDPDCAPIDDPAFRDKAKTIYQLQATAFESAGNIYAPFYRQLAIERLPEDHKEAIAAAGNEPATDAFAALDYYFEHYNQGKPYILAGHSQGSVMISMILADYMKAHPDRYELMIAAYQIGYSVTTDYLKANPHVKAAQKADDTGVVISWNTEGVKNLGQFNFVLEENSVCINPVNWKTDETPATVEENKGSLIVDAAGGLAIGKGIADATINLERGSVICTSVDPEVYTIPMVSFFGPESYHSHDYSLYYNNIKENAVLRVKTFLESQ